MINDNENIITEYEGTVSELRLASNMPPYVIGEYGISVWDIRTGKLFNADFEKMMILYDDDDLYSELLKVIGKRLIDITNYSKLVLINSFVVREEYRKRGITEEFIESIHRDFYDDNVLVLMLVKPFQDNEVNADYYMDQKMVQIRNNLKNINEFKEISACEYYSLEKFYEEEDKEMNEYKLFAVANRCGFNRVGESYLFKYSPEKTVERMIKKSIAIQKLTEDENAH
jgi:hypothetical protein